MATPPRPPPPRRYSAPLGGRRSCRRRASRRAPPPAPPVSHAVLRANRGQSKRLADGIVVTPSHNPPSDGGFKYNPPPGAPAGTPATAATRAPPDPPIRARPG